MNVNTIYPGATITACNLSFVVWIILFQDMHAPNGERDIEFIDADGFYHRWKEGLDAGTVTSNGIPGKYYRMPGEYGIIAAIRAARDGKTFSLRVISKDGLETYYGRYSTIESAEKALFARRPGQWAVM